MVNFRENIFSRVFNFAISWKSRKLSPAKISNNMVITLLHLSWSVGMHNVIGQFCGPYFIYMYDPLNLSNYLPAHPINLRDVINILLALFSWPVYCKSRILVFTFWFMASALCAWAINQWEKNLVHSLQYGPQTRLVRLILTFLCFNLAVNVTWPTSLATMNITWTQELASDLWWSQNTCSFAQVN